MRIGRSIFKIVLIIATFVILLSVDSTSYAQDGLLVGTDISVSVDSAIYSKYVWRGFKLDDDPVFQNGLTVDGHGFSLNIWGSMDIDNSDELNSDEFDYTLDYTYEADKYSLSIGHIWYTFPPSDAKSTELYIGGSLNTLLSPSLTWFHDYGDEEDGGGDGDYVVLSLSHSVPVADSGTMFDFGGSLAYNNELFIAGSGGDVSLSAGFTIPLSSKSSFVPTISYSMPYGDMEDEADGAQDSEFFAGLTVSFEL
ncbi:MAG: hypothetical protein KAI43_11080 [Candidatus Aureabacteria bacterium]|nr:hypothetical protein [Candidatus Auribacterota bacterium]